MNRASRRNPKRDQPEPGACDQTKISGKCSRSRVNKSRKKIKPPPPPQTRRGRKNKPGHKETKFVPVKGRNDAWGFRFQRTGRRYITRQPYRTASQSDKIRTVTKRRTGSSPTVGKEMGDEKEWGKGEWSQKLALKKGGLTLQGKAFLNQFPYSPVGREKILGGDWEKKSKTRRRYLVRGTVPEDKCTGGTMRHHREIRAGNGFQKGLGIGPLRRSAWGKGGNLKKRPAIGIFPPRQMTVSTKEGEKKEWEGLKDAKKRGAEKVPPQGREAHGSVF